MPQKDKPASAARREVARKINRRRGYRDWYKILAEMNERPVGEVQKFQMKNNNVAFTTRWRLESEYSGILIDVRDGTLKIMRTHIVRDSKGVKVSDRNKDHRV